LKDEALDRTLWRSRFGRGCGPVVRQTAKWILQRCIGKQWSFVVRIIWSTCI